MSAGTCEACKALTGELVHVCVVVEGETESWSVCRKCVVRFKTNLRRWLW